MAVVRCISHYTVNQVRNENKAKDSLYPDIIFYFIFFHHLNQQKGRIGNFNDA
jgi:hypothetical protein